MVGLVGFAVILPYGNVAAIDAFFFGASASTESGLNTFDVKNLKTYQQLVIYVIPTIAHIAVINIMVIATQLYWFERRLKQVGIAINARYNLLMTLMHAQLRLCSAGNLIQRKAIVQVDRSLPTPRSRFPIGLTPSLFLQL